MTASVYDNEHPHRSCGEPIKHTLTDGSAVWDCPCGYAYTNEREAMTGWAYAPGTIGRRMEQEERAINREVDLRARCNGRMR